MQIIYFFYFHETELLQGQESIYSEKVAVSCSINFLTKNQIVKHYHDNFHILFIE